MTTHRRPATSTRVRRFAAMLYEAFCGIALIKIHVILGRLLRNWRTTWGTTAAERDRTYPGDDLIRDPGWKYTHAVTVAASPAEVWPWIVQIGQGRGGLYSYVSLENLIGCRITNTDSVLPEFQQLRPGDGIRLHPKAPPIPVVLVEPDSHLVMHGYDPQTSEGTVWGFHLLPHAGGTTRLIERGCYSYGPSLRSRLTFGPLLLEPISFVMSRKMLLTIRKLAERLAVSGAEHAGAPIRASVRSRSTH